MLKLTFSFYCLLYTFYMGICSIGKTWVFASMHHRLEHQEGFFLFLIHMIVNFSFNNFWELPLLSFQVTLHLNDSIQAVEWENKQILSFIHLQPPLAWTLLQEAMKNWCAEGQGKSAFLERRFRVKINWFQFAYLSLHSFNSGVSRLYPAQYLFL